MLIGFLGQHEWDDSSIGNRSFAGDDIPLNREHRVSSISLHLCQQTILALLDIKAVSDAGPKIGWKPIALEWRPRLDFKIRYAEYCSDTAYQGKSESYRLGTVPASEQTSTSYHTLLFPLCLRQLFLA